MLRSSVTKRLRSSRKREEGQTTAEYGVVLTLITLALLTAFTVLSGGVQGAIDRVVGLTP